MEVKEEPFDAFSEEKTNISQDSFNMTLNNIKEETPDYPFEMVNLAPAFLLTNIKSEPNVDSTAQDIPNEIVKVRADEYFVSTTDLANIQMEEAEVDCTTVKTEPLNEDIDSTNLNEEYNLPSLNEECDLPSIKVEVTNYEYLDEIPSNCQTEQRSPSKFVKRPGTVFKKKKFPCPICQKNFLVPSRRKRHLISHFGKNRYAICHFCGKIFKTLVQYIMHYRNYKVKGRPNLTTSNESIFPCKICPLQFDSKRNLADHFKIHYSKPYECKLCFKQYSVKSTLKRHLAALHSVLKPYKCEICFREFALSCQYKSHMVYHKFGKQFTCDICSKGFYQKSSLLRHIIVHEGIKFKCHLCSKEYTRKVTLESHMRLHSGEHEFKCHICIIEKKFTSKGALRLHLMNHAGEKPHKCDICGQRFLERQKLLKHLKTHEKAQNNCEFCSASFLYKIRLQRHLLTEHGENPFKCHKCEQKFVTQRELNLHMSVHVESKIYECELCAKRFTKRAAYVRHLGGHGQSPFGCGVCTETFSSERGLREHYVNHPGEKPFHCDVCLKGFHHKRSLHKHICEGKPPGT
uniref:Gastrula zinc finger protein XlCGF57.1-like n=1 Tax=Diabrotica virgifera virgifera TaxID=50390 RepID=A0A6P7FGL2_DIAVI